MNVLDAIAARTSVRSFSARPLAQGDLDILLQAAANAPVTRSRYGEFHLTVILKDALLAEISKFYADGLGMDLLYGAPALIVVSASKGIPEAQAYASAGCIVQNIQLAALELGLGSVFNWAAGADLRGQSQILEQLDLPEGFIPLTGVLVGEPSGGPLPTVPSQRTARHDLASTVIH